MPKRCGNMLLVWENWRTDARGVREDVATVIEMLPHLKIKAVLTNHFAKSDKCIYVFKLPKPSVHWFWQLYQQVELRVRGYMHAFMILFFEWEFTIIRTYVVQFNCLIEFVVQVGFSKPFFLLPGFIRKENYYTSTFVIKGRVHVLESNMMRPK